MSLDLNTMSRKELQKLQRDVDKAIKSLATRERKAALEAAEKAAADHGFSLSDLAGMSKTKGAAKSKSPAKFRNPDNADQTWTGKGRQPQWFKDAINAGKSESDFAI